jgi:VWFA-related protein
MRNALTHLCIATLVASHTTLLAQDLGPAQPMPQTFRSTVDLVTIQASVRDGRGRVVNGLRTGDFEVRDNGELRTILSLRSDRESPLCLAILVDMSGSMRIGPKIGMAQKTYDSFLTQLKTGRDEVALFTFDVALHERRGFTTDIDSLRGALSDFEAYGTTSLYDATGAVAQRLASRSGTHKAILLLTDGIDTSSKMTAQEVSGLASSIDVPVFVIATVPSIDQRVMLETSKRRNAADLRDLADWTGGQLVFANSLLETALAATRLIGDLRQQYILAIEAAGTREWRRLDVRVRKSSTVVKARSGYFSG